MAEKEATDKEQLIDLNERLHFYVRRVRQLRDESDLETFYKSIATLEDEIKEVRKNYESEISKLKYAIEILNREKSEMEKDIIARKNMEAHLNDRLNVEVDKCSRFTTEISHLKNEIVDKDYQIRDLNMKINQAQYENSGMRKELEGKTRLAEDLKRQLDLSKNEFKDTTNRLQIVEEKLSFQESFSEERINELKRRIETYLMQIAELENKCELGEQREAAFPDQLRKVKEESDAEVRKFQRETDDFYKGTIQTLQTQLEEEIGEKKSIQQEVERLNDKIIEYRNQVTELKSQVTSLEQQKRILNQSLESERHQSTYTINGLERKLKEVQQAMLAQVNEISEKRDVAASLRAELDAMRTLLVEEESRLGIKSKPQAPLNFPHQQPNHKSKENSERTHKFSSSRDEVTVTVERTTESTIKESTMKEAKTKEAVSASANSSASAAVADSGDADWRKMRFLAEETRIAEENEAAQQQQQKERKAEDSGLQLDLCSADSDESDDPNGPKTPRETKAAAVVGPVAASPRPVGPVAKQQAQQRPMSSKRHSARNEGEGVDYFQEMFSDADERLQNGSQHAINDTGIMQSSAVGDVKILEVNPEGKFVRVLNSNEKQEAEFGDYAVQQNIGGHPIAQFRFPPRTKVKPNSTATIWAGCNAASVHQPPTDFYWSEYHRFNTGPECTTVVCDPNGQSVAWTTPYHRFTKDAFLITTPTASQKSSVRDPNEEFDGVEPDARLPAQSEQDRADSPATLRREKAVPLYVATRHPHGNQTGSSVHPRHDASRTGLLGNDNSSVNRQARSQATAVPDPVPGEPYTGSSNQVLGSARIMKHYQSSMAKSNTIGNRAPDVIIRSDNAPPSPFSKPHGRLDSGMKQVQSMHNEEHLPPMPRPPAVRTE